MALTFDEAKELLCQCKLVEELDIEFLPGGEFIEYSWVNDNGEEVARGTWRAKDGTKATIQGTTFEGKEAEELTKYYKDKKTNALF